MVFEFIQVFSTIRSKQHFFADDGIDKLNRSITVIFLIISALLVGTRQLIGPAIVCMKDHQATLNIEIDFIQHVCWAKNTYHLANYNNELEYPRTEITYYQWLVFILLFLAFLYYLPYLLWKHLIKTKCIYDTHQIPIDISGVIKLLKDKKLYRMKEFNDAIKEVVDYLDHCFIYNSVEYQYALKYGYLADRDYDSKGRLNLVKLNDKFLNASVLPAAFSSPKSSSTASPKRKAYVKPSCFCVTPFNGSALIFKYLFIKLVYILVSISVLYFLNLFLNFNEADGSYLFGFQILNNLFIKKSLTHEKSWESKHFPRVVFCEMKAKADWRNTHTIQFQCSLPSNVFNEKIFIFLWFWFLLVAILNCLSLFKWIFNAFNRYYLIKNYLNLIGTKRNSAPLLSNNNRSSTVLPCNSRLINLFITNYLKYDGFFMLLLVRANLNDLYFKRLIESLWNIYSISNLDDDDIMQPTPPITRPYSSSAATTVVAGGKVYDESGDGFKNFKQTKLDLTSPNVVPQQPSGNKYRSGYSSPLLKKSLITNNDDNISESKMKLLNDDKIDDIDYFDGDSQQKIQSQAKQPPSKGGSSYVGFRKEDLV